MAEFISKNRIYDLIHAVYSVHGFTSYEDYVGLLKDVENSTNADVQPVKHGYWKEEEPRVLKCSVCGEYAPMNYLGQNCIDSRYCPWCGSLND